ncbi:hypothetical protein D6764_03130 [Candidatus Woesearchaeota archaeon]|nr:MAG: hypothetical protein D6764_03130 [Candidatus Woesearchaeota archaeon]
MLDRYLEERQQSRPTDFIIRRKQKEKKIEKVPEIKEDEIVIEEREPTFFERLFGRRKKKELELVEDELEEEIEKASTLEEMEEEFEELEEAEQIIEEKKMSLWRRILEKIKGATVEEEEPAVEEDVVYDEEDFVVPPDLKEVLKIQNEWLKRLPPAALKEFKSSEDFKRYQEILRKYGLIK